MKKLIVFCFVFTLSFVTMEAQNRNNQEHKNYQKTDMENGNFSDRNNKELEDLDKQLSLTDSQKSKIKKIMEEDDARNRPSGSPSSSKNGNYNNDREDRNSKIEKILTKKQKSKYSEIKNQRPERRDEDQKNSRREGEKYREFGK